MDVEMPDGTVITDVPEGTTRGELLRRFRKRDVTAQDRAQAAAAGVNKGVLSNLPGLPVDTALNVTDLVKAGIGYVGGKTGMIATENLPQLTDRQTIPGSSEWFAQRERAAGLGRVIDPNRPEDTASRVLHAAGQGAGFPMPAASVPQALRMAAQAGLGGALAQGTAEAGHPEWAPVAGMAPFAGAALPRGNQSKVKPGILTPEQEAVRRRMQELGYELTPSQLTGKKWQQNLEAAMREAPTTSGRMQAIEARNTERTQQLAAQAQEQVGGPMDQGTAAASAFGGMRSGIANEAARTGEAYKALLTDVPVNLSATRKPLEQLRGELLRYPEHQQGGKAATELTDLLGTPGYVARTPKAYEPAKVNPNVDDIVTAVRRNGGINPADEAVGSLAKSNPFPPSLDGPVWRQAGYTGGGRTGTSSGHSLDRMAEMLHEQGYLADRNALDELMGKLNDSSLGNGQHFSLFKTQEHADPMVGAIEALTAKLTEQAKPPEAKPGFLRTNPEIPGPIAQDLRSAYGSSAESAFAQGGKVQEGGVYQRMKEAIDGAISKALPDAKRGQFEALNRKYGLDMAIKAMTPENQTTFLSQLYRGAPDQFYTFLGVIDAKSLHDVRRGFVAELLADAKDKAGNVSAAKLGLNITALEPGSTGRADVMRFLGDKAGPLLRDIGNAGQVLPDQVANSGSAQRLAYQSLLRGGGVLGAGAGGGVAGIPGAMVGAAVGQFAVPKAIQAAYLSPMARGLLTGKAGARFGPDEALRKRLGGLLGYSTAIQ